MHARERTRPTRPSRTPLSPRLPPLAGRTAIAADLEGLWNQKGAQRTHARATHNHRHARTVRKHGVPNRAGRHALGPTPAGPSFFPSLFPFRFPRSRERKSKKRIKERETLKTKTQGTNIGATPTWAFRTPEGEGRLSKISQMFLASHAW